MIFDLIDFLAIIPFFFPWGVILALLAPLLGGCFLLRRKEWFLSGLLLLAFVFLFSVIIWFLLGVMKGK